VQGAPALKVASRAQFSDLEYVPSEVTQVFPVLRNKFALPTCQISREVYVVVVKRELVIAYSAQLDGAVPRSNGHLLCSPDPAPWIVGPASPIPGLSTPPSSDRMKWTQQQRRWQMEPLLYQTSTHSPMRPHTRRNTSQPRPSLSPMAQAPRTPASATKPSKLNL